MLVLLRDKRTSCRRGGKGAGGRPIKNVDDCSCNQSQPLTGVAITGCCTARTQAQASRAVTGDFGTVAKTQKNAESTFCQKTRAQLVWFQTSLKTHSTEMSSSCYMNVKTSHVWDKVFLTWKWKCCTFRHTCFLLSIWIWVRQTYTFPHETMFCSTIWDLNQKNVHFSSWKCVFCWAVRFDSAKLTLFVMKISFLLHIWIWFSQSYTVHSHENMFPVEHLNLSQTNLHFSSWKYVSCWIFGIYSAKLTLFVVKICFLLSIWILFSQTYTVRHENNYDFCSTFRYESWKRILFVIKHMFSVAYLDLSKPNAYFSFWKYVFCSTLGLSQTNVYFRS